MSGLIEPDKSVIYDTSQLIDLDTVPLLNGGILVKTLVVSIEAHFRARLVDAKFNPVSVQLEIARSPPSSRSPVLTLACS